MARSDVAARNFLEKCRNLGYYVDDEEKIRDGIRYLGGVNSGNRWIGIRALNNSQLLFFRSGESYSSQRDALKYLRGEI